ncbi:MAG: N-alpha-acetyl diaminobutyric acid deacetylase DoeB [Hyphomicrobiales bacterium]|nr:MAG: N-alpha-acetyl diaminobutyric acid deacetylase DoeB [Hyphomicrobiales bacterium]
MSNISTDLPSKITTDIDFDKPGVQHGALTMPYSHNLSPWGSILMPVSVFAGGTGPTVLLVGGNHGDEYEGPIACMKLIRELDIDKLTGRVIVIPALNYPAVKNGTRLSPIDGKNMNRAFPGDRAGTVTDMIADYVQRFILPLCDAVADIHAGGRMMSFLPTSVIHRLADARHMDRTLEAAKAFNAPNCLVLEELDPQGMLDTAVEELGTLFISTELGGGGSMSVETVRIAYDGMRNLLVHMGVLSEPLRKNGDTRFLETPDGAFVTAEQDGILEFAAELGQKVSAGEAIAYIHDIDRPMAAPAVYRAPLDGIVMHRHVAGLIGRGDCLSVIAVEI